MKKMLVGLLVTTVFIASIAWAFQTQPLEQVMSLISNNTSADDADHDTKGATHQDTADSAKRVTLFAGGDMVFHPIVYSPQYETVVPPYDFDQIYKRMATRIAAADYATVTFETVCNPNRPYAGFPMFNTPPESIKAIHDAGFDAFSTATNHCLDADGLEGLRLTLQEMDRQGVARFGCKLEANEPMLMTDVDGIQMAFLNYADAYNGMEVTLKAEEQFHISPLKVDAVCHDIRAAREAGADIVAVYPHWGQEYQTMPSKTQIGWAHQIAEAGADVIIGSHPHVLQPSEWVEYNGRKTFIVYSLGNAVSNQRAAFLGTIDTEIGAFAEMTFVKDKDGARVEEATLLPSTVYIDRVNGKLSYQVALIDDLLNGQYREDLSASELAHIEKLDQRAKAILGQTVPSAI